MRTTPNYRSLTPNAHHPKEKMMSWSNSVSRSAGEEVGKGKGREATIPRREVGRILVLVVVQFHLLRHTDDGGLHFRLQYFRSCGTKAREVTNVGLLTAGSGRFEQKNSGSTTIPYDVPQTLLFTSSRHF